MHNKRMLRLQERRMRKALRGMPGEQEADNEMARGVETAPR
jgi:hypothetical protein